MLLPRGAGSLGKAAGGCVRYRRARLPAPAGWLPEFALQLRELADEEETRRVPLERRMQQLESLKKFALPLIDRLAELPREAPWGTWLDLLSGLAETALRHPESVLSMLNELRPMAEVGPVALDEVYSVLSDRLRFLRTEPPPRRYGRVWIGSIEEARGRSFDVVFPPELPRISRAAPRRPLPSMSTEEIDAPVAGRPCFSEAAPSHRRCVCPGTASGLHSRMDWHRPDRGFRPSTPWR
jgi:hypothetical protein